MLQKQRSFALLISQLSALAHAEPRYRQAYASLISKGGRGSEACFILFRSYVLLFLQAYDLASRGFAEMELHQGQDHQSRTGAPLQLLKIP